MNPKILLPAVYGTECIIPVCGASRDMNGARFFSYAKEASNYFKGCKIVLCDTLDAHNMAAVNSSLWGEALEIAKAGGDRWIRKHLDTVSEMFGHNISLIRWDELKSDPAFTKRLDLSQRLYNEKAEVKKYLYALCKHYVDIACDRIYQKGHVPDKNKMMDRSIAYMIEEVAGTATYYDWLNLPAVYPGEYFNDPEFFNKHNDIIPTLKMTVPQWFAVDFMHEETIAA